MMNRKEFMNALEDILMLDIDTLKESDRLADIENWDSLAHLSLLALFNTHFQKSISAQEIRSFKTVADILAKADLQ